MTTYTNFVPSAASPFQFQPTMDGQIVSVVIKWNLFGQRYYVECSTLSGELIFNLPLIGSAVGVSLESLTCDVTGLVTAETAVPHPYAVGNVVKLSISGVAPADYNGTYLCTITSPTEFQYQISTTPVDANAYGTVSYDVNLAGGYFDTSTLVYRQANMQFEVNP